MLRPCFALCLALAACQPEPASSAKPAPPPAAADPAPAPGRVVAVGDIHGDLAAARAALLIAGVVDAAGKWTGGETILVQTGDVLDRGDAEQAIMDWLIGLQPQAEAAGGRVVLLNGNHEAMNVMGDLRYVTPGGFADFEDAPGVEPAASDLATVPEGRRARVAAFRPGGAYARKLAKNPIMAVVGDSVFVHGGVLPKYATRAAIAEANAAVSAWMRGDAPIPPVVLDIDGPLWSRHFSSAPDAADCALLAQSLAQLGVKRMVMGHTPQLDGIQSACDGQAWMVDTGMSRFYGGKPAALIIEGGTARPARGQ